MEDTRKDPAGRDSEMGQSASRVQSTTGRSASHQNSRSERIGKECYAGKQTVRNERPLFRSSAAHDSQFEQHRDVEVESHRYLESIARCSR